MMAFHDITATQVTNINLNVKDLNMMTEYYTTILGFSIKEQDDNKVILAVGTGGHTLTLQLLVDGREPSPREAGLFHIAYLLPTTEDLANFLYFVAQKGMGMGAGDHLVSEALYFNDPEGNGIEVYHDRPANEWQWEDGKVKMDTLEVDGEALIQHRTLEGWQGMPDGAMIGHLHLKTHDLDDARHTYIDQLGLEHISVLPRALFMSTNHYHHHMAANMWQSNQKRIDNHSSYGLTHIDIYKPNVDTYHFNAPEGFNITVHSNTDLVPIK
ncbi:Glyoxalase family protein [Staphylococcus simiae]|nr:Glyoxalase family protein [Staphylococcus simiae]